MTYDELVVEHTRLHKKYFELNVNAHAAIAREIEAVRAELDAVEAAIKQHPQHLANRNLANRHL